MKNRNILAVLLALVMTFMVLSTSASASTSNLTLEAMYYVSVDDEVIPNVRAYQGKDGNYRVYSSEELLSIFPNELKGQLITYDPAEGIVLNQYITKFGYTARVVDKTLTLTSKGSTPTQPSQPTTPPSDTDISKWFWSNTGSMSWLWTDGSIPSWFWDDDFSWFWSGSSWTWETVETRSFKFYINGSYVSTMNDKVLENVNTSGKVILSGDHIYINDNGSTPVEVYVNGKLVEFPDQQPVIVDPGRTMVPIRSVAELIEGCEVTWDSTTNSAIITRGNSKMVIFPGKTSYLLDGKYYDMDVSPVIIGNRTMVPIRFIAEAFDFKVDFQSGNVFKVLLN